MNYLRLILLSVLFISCGNISPLEGKYPSGGKQEQEKPQAPSEEITPPQNTVKILFIGIKFIVI